MKNPTAFNARTVALEQRPKRTAPAQAGVAHRTLVPDGSDGSSVEKANAVKKVPARRAEIPEHFNFQTVCTDEMLRPCAALLHKAREIGVGGLCPPLSDNLKAKRLYRLRGRRRQPGEAS